MTRRSARAPKQIQNRAETEPKQFRTGVQKIPSGGSRLRQNIHLVHLVRFHAKNVVFLHFSKFCQKMLRIGLTCIVWYADAEFAIETRFRAYFGIIFAIPNFQTVASKIPPSVFLANLASRAVSPTCALAWSSCALLLFVFPAIAQLR